MSQLEPQFDHTEVEKRLWDFWISLDAFHADENSTKTPYTVLIPPPNVTARLHMGHGLNNTIQDILVRWKRMQGFNACWLPGTDHAGISTQMMVERSLTEQGTSRRELGRDSFLERCKAWKDENGGIIIDQLKRLGASCDWQRQAYTMDETLSQAVREVFVRLFNDGLIYRGERLVNWDSKLQTAVSDDEVETEEVSGFLYSVRYQLEGSDDSLVIATTRPETLFGDTAVAVNPHDDRYKGWIGRKIIVPLCDRAVPIIGDEKVKMDFGTGCLKVTPAHDPVDFDLGKRHNLPFVNVLTEDGMLNEVAPAPFCGMEKDKARKAVVKALEAQGRLIEVKPYKHAVPISERSKVVIEPRLSKQWYVRMKELAKPAIESAHRGELAFFPENLRKVYLHWLENIEDWCISRQIWWGHQIPIWYCQGCNAVQSTLTDPTLCAQCNGSKLKRDEDVLDTWFSSWLWPLSPFGWPRETQALKTFFPSQVLVTGSEIIFLWVARMVMVSFYLKGQSPFSDVYFNSIICDKNGKKFSKTLGNGIDPIEVIDRFGADAVRFTCVNLAPLGGRVRMDIADFAMGQRFVTKIWNAARFLLNTNEGEQLRDFDDKTLSLSQKWLISELHHLTKTINTSLSQYGVNEAVAALYHGIWQSFCDWGLELAKIELGHQEKSQVMSVLFYVFEGLLRLAAPVMPFVTDEVWQKIPKHPRWSATPSLVTAEFPNEGKIPCFETEFREFASLQELISSIRSVRTQAGVPPKEQVRAVIECDGPMEELVQRSRILIEKMGALHTLTVKQQFTHEFIALVGTGPGFLVYLDIANFIDIRQELARLEGEKIRMEKIVAGIQAKLDSPAYVGKAPQDVVAASRAQLQNMNVQLRAIRENIRSLIAPPSQA